MIESSAIKQLELIDKKMSETSAAANKHLSQFLFGGLIAVIALLNTDILLLKAYKSEFHRMVGTAIVGFVAIVLAHNYFVLVIRQYNDHRKSHRKLKYKYELTLHCMLSSGKDKDYQRYLELGIPSVLGESEIKFPDTPDFMGVADYLRDHHGRKLNTIADKPKLFFMAMNIVYITLAVKVLSLASIYFLNHYLPNV